VLPGSGEAGIVPSRWRTPTPACWTWARLTASWSDIAQQCEHVLRATLATSQHAPERRTESATSFPDQASLGWPEAGRVLWTVDDARRLGTGLAALLLGAQRHTVSRQADAYRGAPRRPCRWLQAPDGARQARDTVHPLAVCAGAGQRTLAHLGPGGELRQVDHEAGAIIRGKSATGT
jgi:hypothetical protein